MLPNTNQELAQLIDSSSHPVLIFVSDVCERNPQHEKIKQEAEKHEKSVALYMMCYTEETMPFPRLSFDVLYFFLPKNQTPVFWRTAGHQNDISHDVDTIHIMMTQGKTYEEAKFSEDMQTKIKKTEEYIKEDLSEYPSLFQQARNLAKDVWKTGKNAAKGLPILVSAEDGFRRLELCRFCDKFDSKTERCSECGCFMKVKTQLASASCPLGKWNSVA